MIIKKFEFFIQPEDIKCDICGSRMYATDKSGYCQTYHCSSEEAKFWNFIRGSAEQRTSKKHWDDSKREICKERSN